jgi:uncharacterized protein YybS (DUF2232 family)
MNEPYLNPTMINANGQPQNSLGRNRLQYFGLTMVVMGISFILYYLGFFGSVDGPLTPAKLGATLSGLGVTQRHVIVILLSLLIHRQSEAHFHPLKKGAVSNTVWIACLAFVIIAFFGV